MSSEPEDYFAATYSDARAGFLAACVAAGAAVSSRRNPKRGPRGEALYTDVAHLGPASAERVLLVVSGTHGAEGFCGSGIQVGLLDHAAMLRHDRGTAVVLVHAINPHGFAWLRRVTEDNIDLNRNFVDHGDGGAYPPTPEYDRLADALVPATWDDATIARTHRTLTDYADAHGLLALQSVVCGGQFSHANGLFYGGRQPCWSRRTLERVVAEATAGAHATAVIDVHTGLGPYGYGEPIAMHDPASDGFARARAWYGDAVTSPAGGTSTSSVVQGHVGEGLERAAPAVRWTNIALEFGTQPVLDVLQALRADAWLHTHGDVDSDQGRTIKAQMRAAFYGDEPVWKAKVWARGHALVSQALAGLAAG